eukprot:15485871-Alexandrium_andersonii.AAC.1
MQQLHGRRVTLACHGDEQAIASQILRLHRLDEVEPSASDVLDALLRRICDVVELALPPDRAPRRDQRILGRRGEQIRHLLERSWKTIDQRPRVPAASQEELVETRVRRRCLGPAAVEPLPDTDGQRGQRQRNHLPSRLGLLRVQHFLPDVREHEGQLSVHLVHLGHQGRQRRRALLLEVADLVHEEDHGGGVAVQMQERAAHPEAVVEAEELRDVPLHAASRHQHVPERVRELRLAPWTAQGLHELLLVRPAAVERQVDRLHRRVLREPCRNQHPSAVHQHGSLPNALHARAAQQRELAVLALVGLGAHALDVAHHGLARLLPVQRLLVVPLRQPWGLVLAVLDALGHALPGRRRRERLGARRCQPRDQELCRSSADETLEFLLGHGRDGGAGDLVGLEDTRGLGNIAVVQAASLQHRRGPLLHATLRQLSHIAAAQRQPSAPALGVQVVTRRSWPLRSSIAMGCRHQRTEQANCCLQHTCM